MVGRTRRVRILAIALCIVTIFFLYTRNSDQVENYTDYFTKSAVGGGSVLRPGEQQKQEPIPRPVEPAPAKETTTTEPAVFAQTTKPIVGHAAVATTSWGPFYADVETTTTAAALRPTPTKGIGYDDELPVEVGLGNAAQQLLDHLTSTSSAIHWTKLPESFPIQSTRQLPTSKPSAIPRVQKRGNNGVDKDRLAAVKEATKHAWGGFRKYGWGYDEVKPVSGGGQNSFNGWGATLVDSLDTLWIMGMTEEFEEAVNKTAEIDFTTSSRNDIPLFEVTIRYLGGMIAAYDVSGRNKKYQVLLDKAVELAEILYSAFDTPNRMPDTYYHWKPTYASNTHRAGTRAVMAELGTLSLEFTRLAQLTGEPKYYDAIARITDAFEEWQGRTRVPGMWPTLMDASGCKKNIRKTPTSTHGQQYIAGGEPVSVDPKLMGEAKNAVYKATADKDQLSSSNGPAGSPRPAGGKAAIETPVSHDQTKPPSLSDHAQPGAAKQQSGKQPQTAPKVGADESTPPQYKSPPQEIAANRASTPNSGKYSVEETNQKMGTVANPMAANVHAADSSANLRHSMDEIEHPLNKESDDLAKKIQNFGTPKNVGTPPLPGTDTIAQSNDNYAKGPLPPKAEAANVETDPKAIPYGQKEHEPLPPQGVGESPIHKRQLEQTEESRIAPVSGAQTQSLPKKPEVQSVAEGKRYDEDDEPECLPQGFESVSKNSPESYTLGGMSDSTYEYLPKMYLLLGGRSDQYKTMYLESMKPVIDQMLYRPMTPDNADILISGEISASINYTTGEPYNALVAKGEHLTCFVGGMFGMGGKIFDLPEHVEIGKKLTDGCVWTYNATKSGIMPESFHMTACESKTNCKWNKTAYYEELDPLFQFREDQRTEFMETYNITDLVAYEKELAATKALEQAAAASSSAAAAAATAAVLYGDENSITPGIPEADLKNLNKRQLVDATLDDKVASGPQLGTADLKPTTTTSTLHPPAVPEGPSGGHANEIPQYGSAYYDDDYVAPPIWTPDPPPTHNDYVQRKIAEERLPAGFVHLDGRAYILRPEAIESVFYMYRITGDQYWRDMGWKMFMSIDTATRAPYGHASIDDITKSHPEQHDKMESFWIAETLKYFYLLFDEPDKWSLDNWVLNTEAHFFRRPENPGVSAL